MLVLCDHYTQYIDNAVATLHCRPILEAEVHEFIGSNVAYFKSDVITKNGLVGQKESDSFRFVEITPRHVIDL